jgi:hypothetical protein
LEKVHPDLYKHVVVLLVDPGLQNQMNARTAVAGMKDNGAAAVPILLAHLKQGGSSGRENPMMEQMLATDIWTLSKIAPEDETVLKEMIELTRYAPMYGGGSRYATMYGGGSQVRSAAVAALGEIWEYHP